MSYTLPTSFEMANEEDVFDNSFKESIISISVLCRQLFLRLVLRYDEPALGRVKMQAGSRTIMRYTENILDHVFTNQPERICGMETFDCQFVSDHLGVSFPLRPK